MAQTSDWHLDWFQASLHKLKQNDYNQLHNPEPIGPEQCIHYQPASATKSNLKIATVKLNGGLGSSMGCSGPKSLIQLSADGQTFLDKIIAAHQRSDHSNALVLLNSFNTEQQTRAHISTVYPTLSWHNVTQQAFKKIDAHSRLPLGSNLANAFNPPGHGSVYFDLYYSGVLQQLMDDGIDYLFISNADNLAATVDSAIVQHLDQTKCPFLIELTPKMDADTKGGTVVTHQGQLTLWEIAQVDADQHSLFESQPYFNTNNIWVSIPALIRVIKENRLLLDLIKNPKVYEQQPVIQMEYAMGSAIQSFSDAQVMVVPRTRFFPVKRTNDLLLLLSDCCSWDADGVLSWSIDALPKVDLSGVLSNVSDFFTYFQCIPNISQLKSLRLQGPVIFDQEVEFNPGAEIALSVNTPTSIGSLI